MNRVWEDTPHPACLGRHLSGEEDDDCVCGMFVAFKSEENVQIELVLAVGLIIKGVITSAKRKEVVWCTEREREKETHYCVLSNVTAGRDMQGTFALSLSILCFNLKQVTSFWLCIAVLSCAIAYHGFENALLPLVHHRIFLWTVSRLWIPVGAGFQ